MVQLSGVHTEKTQFLAIAFGAGAATGTFEVAPGVCRAVSALFTVNASAF
ncbi:MAG: hypothetical protein ACTXOO_01270 [Sodalis sp. (in: enterobacteria)]